MSSIQRVPEKFFRVVMPGFSALARAQLTGGRAENLIRINSNPHATEQHPTRMKHSIPQLTAGALVLAAINTVYAQQYAAPAPQPAAPYPGLVNEWLRSNDPAWAKWDIGGSVRLRYEIKEGAGFTASGSGTDFRRNLAAGQDNINSYFMDRVRARIGYSDKWWGVMVEGRSSSTTGDDRNPNAESDGIVDLHQAYVTLGNPKESPISLKVGRQELSYGEERLIGAFDWNNIGRVFDAAKATWKTANFSADFFTSRVVLPNDNHFNMPNDYDYFSGVYATTKVIPKNTTEVYFLSRNVSAGSLKEITTTTPTGSAGPRDIYSLGFRMKSNPGEFGPWDYCVEAIGQFGHYNDSVATGPTKSLQQQAYAFILQGGYTWKDAPGKPRLGLEYSHASGDSNPGDNKHETFENLFPTNHKFYGYMDLVSLQNIHDVRLVYSMKPTTKTSVSLEGHAFWLADTHDSFYNVAGARRGGTGATTGSTYGINSNYGSYVGSELDLIGGYTPTKYLAIEAGYGHFFRGDYIRESLSKVGTRDADWVYIQTRITF
jgi:hypothetical protein